MKGYQYILLDWDGNLAKTLDIWLEACRAPLIKRGVHKTDEEIAMSFGAYPAHLRKWGLGDQVDEIFSEADAIASRKLPSVELYPDALEVLSVLKKLGKKTALITTSHKAAIAPALERYNMEILFDAIVTYDDTEKHKPHAEPLEKALELIGGNKADTIMIGDSDKDLGAAANAEIDSILFYPPEHKKFYIQKKLEEHKPTYVIDDFRKVIDITNLQKS